MQKNENRRGYKKTKVGWIPKNWELIGAEDVCVLITKGTTPKVRGNEVYTDPVPYLRVQNLSFDGSLLFEQDRLFIERACHESELARSRLFPGDVLTNIVGPPLGKVSLVPGTFPEWNMNQAIAVFRTKADCCEKLFLCHYLQTRRARAWLDGQARKTSGQKNLTLETCRELPIPLPSLPEQEAIAEVLECWDKAIRGYERKIEKKRNIKKGLMQRLLSGKQRLPGFDEEWRMVRVRRLFRVVSEKAGNGGGELLSVTQDRGAIPRAMLEGRVMSPESGTSGYKLVRKGDFVISLRSFQGGLEYSAYNGLVSPAYTILRPTVDLDEAFYRHFFKSYEFIGRYLAKAVVGIRDGKQISVPVFATVELPVPQTDEQRAIATVLSSADADIAALDRKLAALRERKRFLLNNMVTGTIRLPQFANAGTTAVTTGDTE